MDDDLMADYHGDEPYAPDPDFERADDPLIEDDDDDEEDDE